MFAIASFVYVGCGMALGFWGVAAMKRRTGAQAKELMRSPKKVVALARAKATSNWDPFSESGERRWQLIFGVGFAVLVGLNFSGL